MEAFSRKPLHIRYPLGTLTKLELAGSDVWDTTVSPATVIRAPTQIQECGDMQITVTGNLDGGTWGVDGLLPSGIWIELQAIGKLTDTVYRIADEVVIQGVRVKFDNLGAGKTGIVGYFTFQGRRARMYAGW